MPGTKKSKKTKKPKELRLPKKYSGGYNRRTTGIVGHLDNLTMLRSILNSMNTVNQMPRVLEQNLQDGFRKLEREKSERKEAKRMARMNGPAPMDVEKAPKQDPPTPMEQQPLGGQTDAMRRANLATPVQPPPAIPTTTTTEVDMVPAELGDATRARRANFSDSTPANSRVSIREDALRSDTNEIFSMASQKGQTLPKVVNRGSQKLTLRTIVALPPKKPETKNMSTQTFTEGMYKRKRPQQSESPYESDYKLTKDKGFGAPKPAMENIFNDYMMVSDRTNWFHQTSKKDFQAETAMLRGRTTARETRRKLPRGNNPFLEYIRGSA